MFKKLVFLLTLSLAFVYAAGVNTNKGLYAVNENIQVSFNDLRGADDDWIGIYQQGNNNDVGNIIQWNLTGGNANGNMMFNGLPEGNYHVRVFYGVDLQTVVQKAIQVEGDNKENPPADNVSLETSKPTYQSGEAITVRFSNMLGNDHDWIGIYPVGAPNDWGNQVAWAWTDGQVNGQKSFPSLPAGNYEVRIFFNDSFNDQARKAFTVEGNAVERVLYDDFEDGQLDGRWQKWGESKNFQILNVGVRPRAVGHTQRQPEINGQKSLRTFADYRDDNLNYAAYSFDFQNPDANLKFLELDMRVGVSSHVFAFGVIAKTNKGDRRIQFASWLNHTLPSGKQNIRGPYGNVLAGHRGAYLSEGNLHVHPGPSDYFVGTTPKRKHNKVDRRPDTFIHYKINIEEKLKELEPDIRFLGMKYFITTGGDYDNLALTSK